MDSAGDRDYHHPYHPYAIQKQFMDGVYNCLDEGKLGIFESPTGYGSPSQISEQKLMDSRYHLAHIFHRLSRQALTIDSSKGKSLSLICASMTWLRDFKRRQYAEALTATETSDDVPAWMLEYDVKQKQQAARRRTEQQEARLRKIKEKEERARARYESGEPPNKRQRMSADSRDADDDQEADFVLDDYESATEEKSSERNLDKGLGLGVSIETQALLDKLGLSAPKPAADEEEDAEDELKIFFCSRTHSQLSQFVNELRKVKLPPALPPEDSGTEEIPPKGIQGMDVAEGMKHVTLGSRKNLCINPKVSRLSSTAAMNERCLELQQSSTNSESNCPYMPKKETEVLVNDFRDHALAKIRDIEDFGKLGRRIGICPYYASRAAITPAEIVTLPYPLLLQQTAREALNINLEGHVVIIDEAHNLLDAISAIHSTSISLSQIKQSRAQLGIYLQKFRNKLKGKNRVYVTQLVRLIDSLATYLEAKLDGLGKDDEGQALTAELMAGKGMDVVNLHKLMRYVQESKIARKVERYLVYAEKEDQRTTNQRSKKADSSAQPSTPVLTLITSFLASLTNPSPEGRFFWSRLASVSKSPANDGSAMAGSLQDITLRYQLLDPSTHFQSVVSSARAVVLAGGTMSPFSTFTDQLLHYLPPEKIQTLSCGHVIPPSNLIAMPVSKGPEDIDFDFTFEKRNDNRMVRELGRAVLDVCNKVPDGVVIFFPSYAYLERVTGVWQRAGSGGEAESIWTQLQRFKRIFSEPRSSSTAPPGGQASSEPQPDAETVNQAGSQQAPEGINKLDTLLRTYSAHIHSADPERTNTGALLLAVINGSLSEGINFSDRLGRCIIVVGLPFPNARTAEWKARLEYAEAHASKIASKDGSGPAAPPAKSFQAGEASMELLENTTMRAVNQSIGRAIRHEDDYAAILLFDRRYERANIKGKLPGWIKESLKCGLRFGQVKEELERFFRGKAP